MGWRRRASDPSRGATQRAGHFEPRLVQRGQRLGGKLDCIVSAFVEHGRPAQLTQLGGRLDDGPPRGVELRRVHVVRQRPIQKKRSRSPSDMVARGAQ